MDRRKELQQQYKEMKTEAGVYQIRNTKNGKVWLSGTPNLKSINGKRISLNLGSFINKELQADWNAYGEIAFEFEVLEILKQKETGYFDLKDELKKLEEKWMNDLQPYEDRGYHRK
ncbi:GIY-YIG nuclease family protein [Paenibacillus hexagrammi]|uniref:GIY-YIG nuclease family protein n=1 Tax=Paenibacillus hexagrammi TaxID=2908839 RepID=A0ABY3SPF3_9BACL|nr:GIY-YIG nuclease family protein [Paenibacillus sp. YPD9-1]UJF35831.1 GIY-YIG nuclease family protein [Paenibacillus sp. YPD9-1]